MPSAPLRLRCEFVSDPVGISATRPRLSWWVNDPRPAELQSAYEILAASNIALLDEDEGDLWRSGRVEGYSSANVKYGGAHLCSQQRVWWKVRTFDSDGLGSSWSDAAYFEIGLLEANDWQAHWIASPLRGSRSQGVPVAALRREFLLTQAVASARLYVAALGSYRVEINGRHVPRSEAATAWVDYDQRVLYQSYDVTSMLLQEPNAIGVLLADGYYSGEVLGYGREHYGSRPQLKLHLDITFVNGEHFTLSSDHQWHWRSSWVIGCELQAGEHIDARQFIPAWSRAGLDECQWAPVDVLPENELSLIAQNYAPFTVQQVLRPQQMPKKYQRPGHTSLVYDFGDQLYGRVNIDLEGSVSDDLTITYSLDELFEDTTTDTYTSSGGTQRETFGSVFSVHQFRFIRVNYCAQETTIGEVTAHRLWLPQRSGLSLRSDHPTLNQLFAVIDNSIQAVSTSVPLAGIAPAEHLPDASYGSTWVRFAARHSRAHALIAKWLDDLVVAGETGQESGYVPNIQRARQSVPIDEMAHFESIVGAAWALYRHQGDIQTLECCYAQIRVAALSYRHALEGLVRQPCNTRLYGEDGTSSLVATATLYGAFRTAGRIAGVLGNLGDRDLIETLAADIKRAFRRRFITQDGHLAADNQSAYVAAIYHKLLEHEEQQSAEQLLVELLKSGSYHCDVAPVVMHGLLPVLTSAGRLDMAYMVLLQTSEPSWMAAVNQGACHVGQHIGHADIAHVGLLEWLMGSLVGLTLQDDYSPDHNGYRSVRVRPMPPLGHQFLAGAPVQFIEASLETMQGNYDVKWWIHESYFELELLVPNGCTALVTMPDDIQQTVRSGHHRFIMDFDVGGDGVPTLLDTAASNL